LGQIWTNPAIGLHLFIKFLTQRLGLFTFDLNCWVFNVIE